MSTLAAERLYPSKQNNKKSASYKYKLSCQDRILHESPSTKDWLEILKHFDHDSENVKIFQALLEKQKQVVVKITNQTNVDKEYNIGQALFPLKLPTILSFYCFFTCLDNFRGIDPKQGLCGRGKDPISVLVMPLIKLGRIDKANWTRDNIHVFNSCLKHVVCTLLLAFETFGFNHNDLHFGNILLKKTKKKHIQYGDRIVLPVVDGYIPVIMDFERSNMTGNIGLMYNDIGRLFNLSSSEINVKMDILMNYTTKSVLQEKTISTKTYEQFCNYIDTRKILYVLSEIK